MASAAIETGQVFHLPDEVLDLARKRQVGDLAAIVRAAQSAFADSAVRVYLESDPELPAENRIIVEVAVNGRTVDEIAAAEDHFESRSDPRRVAGIVCLRLSHSA